MDILDTEISNLFHYINNKYKNSKCETDFYNYNIQGIDCNISVFNPNEFDNSYIVDIYFNNGSETININDNSEYYIHESYERLDGIESFVRTLLINRYGYNEYLEKLKSLI